MSEGAYCLAVNVPDRIAVRDDDVVGIIILLIDEEGDDTDDPECAVVAVVEWPDETWSAEDLRDYETRRTN